MNLARNQGFSDCPNDLEFLILNHEVDPQPLGPKKNIIFWIPQNLNGCFSGIYCQLGDYISPTTFFQGTRNSY